MVSEYQSTILLIEDNIISQLLMQRTLKKVLGSNTVIYSPVNSKTALTLYSLHNKKLDLIICDGNLNNSEHQGPEIIDIILTLQKEEKLDIPVYAWTDDQNKLYSQHKQCSPDSHEKGLHTNSFFLYQAPPETFEDVFNTHKRPFLRLTKPVNYRNLSDELDFLSKKPIGSMTL